MRGLARFFSGCLGRGKETSTVANILDLAFGCAFMLDADDTALLHWVGGHRCDFVKEAAVVEKTEAGWAKFVSEL